MTYICVIFFFLHCQVLHAQFGGKSLANLAAEPNRLAILDALGRQLHQQLDRLIVIDTAPTSHNIPQAIDGIQPIVLVRRSRIRHKTHLQFPLIVYYPPYLPDRASHYYLLIHVKHRLHVILVELFGRDWADQLERLVLVVIRPGKGGVRDAQTDADYAVDGRHLLLD